MSREKLKICLRLVKEGHINETEFEQLMQTEKEYVSVPVYREEPHWTPRATWTSDSTAAASNRNLTQTWKNVSAAREAAAVAKQTKQ